MCGWRCPVVLFLLFFQAVYGGIYSGLQAKLSSPSSLISSASSYLTSNSNGVSTLVCSDRISVGELEQRELHSLLLALKSFIHDNQRQSQISSYFANDIIGQLAKIFQDNSISGDDCAHLARLAAQVQDLSSIGSSALTMTAPINIAHDKVPSLHPDDNEVTSSRPVLPMGYRSAGMTLTSNDDQSPVQIIQPFVNPSSAQPDSVVGNTDNNGDEKVAAELRFKKKKIQKSKHHKKQNEKLKIADILAAESDRALQTSQIIALLASRSEATALAQSQLVALAQSSAESDLLHTNKNKNQNRKDEMKSEEERRKQKQKSIISERNRVVASAHATTKLSLAVVNIVIGIVSMFNPPSPPTVSQNAEACHDKFMSILTNPIHFSEASFYRYGGMTELHPPSSRIVQVQRSVCITTASWIFTVLSGDYPQVTMSLGSTNPFARLEKALSRINHGDSAAVIAVEAIGGHFFVIQRRGSDGKYRLYQSWVDIFEPNDWESDVLFGKHDIPHFLYIASPDVAYSHINDLNGAKKEHSSSLWFDSGLFIDKLDGFFNYISSSPRRPISLEDQEYQMHLKNWNDVIGIEVSKVAVTTQAIEPKAQLTSWTEKGCESNYEGLVAELDRRHENYSGPEADPAENAYVPGFHNDGGSVTSKEADVTPTRSSKRRKSRLWK